MNRAPVDDAAGRGHVEEAGLGVDHSVEESLGEKIHRDMEVGPKEIKTVSNAKESNLVDGYASIGTDPEEEEVPEKAGHGLPHSEPTVHPEVKPVVLDCYSVLS